MPDGLLAQHAYVASLVAALREAHAEGDRRDGVTTRIDEVLGAVREHFASEEEQMRRYGYPGLEAHHQQHETFLRRLTVLRGESDHGDAELLTMFVESLEQWLYRHEHTADEAVLRFLGLDGGAG